VNTGRRDINFIVNISSLDRFPSEAITVILEVPNGVVDFGVIVKVSLLSKVIKSIGKG
jgi:hypothetical protein